MSAYNRSRRPQYQSVPTNDYDYNNNSQSYSTRTRYSQSNSRNDNYNSINYGNGYNNQLFTRDCPILPSLSNNDNFSSRIMVVRNIIEWLDEQCDILDKLYNKQEFETIDNKIKSIYNSVDSGFCDLDILLKNKSMSNISQDKARMKSLKEQYEVLKKRIKRLLYKTRNNIKIQKHRAKLMSGTNRNSKEYSIADEQSSLNSSHQIIDQTLKIVNNVTSELWSQKGLLTQTKNKLLNMTNLVGFSQSLIRVITQRSTVDQWILFGGMFLTLLIIILLWWYVM